MLRQQKGFLLVTAVVIVVVVGLLSAILVKMFMRSNEMTLRLRSIPLASALAQSALEQAQKNFTLTNLNARQACVSLATTVSLSTGDSITGRASNTANNPRYAYATLTTPITSTSTPTTITVNDSSVFSATGWVMIGREVFQYTGIGGATTLTGVTRALDTSIATDHVSGELVSQYQCYIAGIGHAPATNPLSIREYQQAARQAVIFAVGQNGTILRWNGDTAELAWSAVASGTVLDLRAVSAMNYHSAWAASIYSAAGYGFDRLEGNAPWSPVYTALGQEQDLLGIYATSSKEVWAVGKRHASDPTILRWVRDANNSSTNWCVASSSQCAGITITQTGVSNAQQDIYAIKTYDYTGDGYADMGFAVGGSHDQSGKIGVIWYYSGTGWSSITATPLNFSLPVNVSELVGLDITKNGNAAPKEAFFVGNNSIAGGELLRLRIVNGLPVWVVLIPAQVLNGVSVIDTDGDGWADFGCAVGMNGTIITFNSNMITTTTTLPTLPNLRAVVVFSTSDIWTVGDGGVSFHYDGTSWTSVPTSTTNNLYGLSAVFPRQTTLGPWTELIN
jgi:Tfp pilus assembly protein PilX